MYRNNQVMPKAFRNKQMVESESTASCPKCGNEMDGIVKNSKDRFLSFWSFKLFYVKRYLCYGCLWEYRKLSVK